MISWAVVMGKNTAHRRSWSERLSGDRECDATIKEGLYATDLRCARVSAVNMVAAFHPIVRRRLDSDFPVLVFEISAGTEALARAADWHRSGPFEVRTSRSRVRSQYAQLELAHPRHRRRGSGVFSILVCPSRIWIARMLPVACKSLRPSPAGASACRTRCVGGPPHRPISRPAERTVSC